MKKFTAYEILAAALAMIGAVLLAFTYFPILNPIQYGLDSDSDASPLGRFILGTPVLLLILSGAWHFNRKAQKLKRGDTASTPE